MQRKPNPALDNNSTYTYIHCLMRQTFCGSWTLFFFLLWHRSELVVLGTPLLSLSGCAFLFTSLFLRCVLWLSSLWPLSYVYFLFAHYSWCNSTMAKKSALARAIASSQIHLKNVIGMFVCLTDICNYVLLHGGGGSILYIQLSDDGLQCIFTIIYTTACKRKQRCFWSNTTTVGIAGCYFFYCGFSSNSKYVKV